MEYFYYIGEFKATGNKKHLTLADRAAIEHGISCGENFTQIAHRINK
ncbi:helix-turn-helix domain-containing protein, partial [Ruminococcus sp. AM44-9AT]